MFLSDRTIKTLIASGVIGVDPYTESNVQPCSLDLTIENIDVRRSFQLDTCIWSVPPGTFTLATTIERITLPAHVASTVSGKSTWGRKGLAVHITAGHIDPGFSGQITLEMYNHSSENVIIRKGAQICQLVFTYLDVAAEHPYSGRYQNQTGIQYALPSLEFQRGLEHPPDTLCSDSTCERCSMLAKDADKLA